MATIKKILMRTPLSLSFSVEEFIELEDRLIDVGTMYQIFLSDRSFYLLTKCADGWEYSHHWKEESAKVIKTTADISALIKHIQRLANGFKPLNDEPLIHPN